jgi:hypothetical protein
MHTATATVAGKPSAACGFLAVLLFTSSALGADSPAPPQYIQQLDLIHFSHTDYGFTDHPPVCRDMQRRYLDLALDAALATTDAPEGERFKWTTETTIAVEDWWNAARPERREEFLRMVRAGQLDPLAIKHFRLSKARANEATPLESRPVVELDDQSWPVAATWPGMKRPLFTAGLGDFVAVRVKGFAPRWSLPDIWERPDATQREALRKQPAFLKHLYQP